MTSLETLRGLYAEELVLGRDIDGTVQANLVVVRDEIRNDVPRVVERQGHLDADAIALEGFVPTFDLAVGLRVIDREKCGHGSCRRRG